MDLQKECSRRLHFEPQVAIIGSSNINDRSLLGMRDSEVNVVVQEPINPF